MAIRDSVTAELWEPVPGYENLYLVSDAGRVVSLERSVTVTTRFGTYTRTQKRRLLKPVVDAHGYMRIVLVSESGQQEQRKLHRLVAEAFLPKPLMKNSTVLHLNDNKKDNRVTNLQWGSHNDNMLDMVSKGRQSIRRGEESALSVLSSSQVREIFDLAQRGVSSREIAAKFGIARGTVVKIKTGIRWHEVTGLPRKLDSGATRRLKKQIDNGVDLQTIAKTFDVSEDYLKELV